MNAITFQWSKRDLWPSRLGMTFFAHAVEIVGQAISTERLNRPNVPHYMPHPPWQSNQLIGKSVNRELPVDSTGASYSEKLIAKTLLAEFAPEQGEPEFMPATDHLPDDYKFTDDQWSAAHYYSTLRLPHPNVREVARAFGIVGSLGVIKAKWVAQDGRLLDINPEIWSQPLAVTSWIGLCQVAQEDVEYFDDDFHSVNHWIFLVDEDIKKIDPPIWFAAGALGKEAKSQTIHLLEQNVPSGKTPVKKNAKKPRRKPQQEHVLELLNDCFPDGTPTKGEMKPGKIVSKVQKFAENRNKSKNIAEQIEVPHRDTILRAAGWRE